MFLGNALLSLSCHKKLLLKHRENLRYCIDLLNVKYDPQECHESILNTFEACLKTPDARYMAIELLKEQAEIWKEKYKKNDNYENQEYTNYFVECIVDIYFELCEIKEGISYFHKQYIKRDTEVKEYILLKKMEEFNLYKANSKLVFFSN